MLIYNLQALLRLCDYKGKSIIGQHSMSNIYTTDNDTSLSEATHHELENLSP